VLGAKSGTEAWVALAKEAVNPRLEIFLVSAISGDGMQDWYGWLRKQVRQVEKTGVC
jgi:Ni2+-binding GTPase involved in maturation of urease and hydrogenase